MEDGNNNVEIYRNRDKEFKLTTGLVNQIENKLNPFSLKLHDLSDQVNLILSLEPSETSCLKAKEILQKHVKIRTSTDKERKLLGDVFKVTKQAIDWTAKGIIEDVQKVEQELKEFATTFERREQFKLDLLIKERSDLLKPYSDPSAFKLGEMDQSVFEMILKGAKSEFEQNQKLEKERIALQAKAEQEDILHKKRTEQIIPSWGFLTAEEKSFGFGTLEDIEFCEIYAYSIESKMNYDKEQEELKKENQILKDQQRIKDEQLRVEKIKQDELVAKARAEKRELERELREREEANRKAKEAKEAEELALKQAPDRDKLIRWVFSFDLTPPDFNTEKFTCIAKQFIAQVQKSMIDAKDKV